MAVRMRNLISLLRSPGFCDGTLPVVRCSLADLHESLFSCAASHAALLKKELSGLTAAHLAAGSMTVSDSSFMKLCMEQV